MHTPTADNEYGNGSQVDQSVARKAQQKPEGKMEETETAAAAEALGVLAETRSDRWCLVERSGFGVRCRYAAIIFSFAIGIASRKVCIGVLPKHQRP
jgi:hypothetical protein